MKHWLRQCKLRLQLCCAPRARLPILRNEAGCIVYVLVLLLPTVTLFADYRFPVGERATYSVHWGLLSCGTSTISCDRVETNGQSLIRIRVRAKSNWLVSTIYPVDDTVDCFIDPETQLSVRLEKDTSEGGFICKDVLEIDRKNNMALWTSYSDNITTNYPIEAGACDAVSFLYDFRRYAFCKNTVRNFNIVVDAALHGITVTAKDTDRKKIGESEKVECRKYLVTPARDDLFVRKIPREIWLTEDDRKIMVRMDVQLPVGKAKIVLDEYVAPRPLHTD